MNTRIIARDLAKQAPHSPRERLGGFAIANRAVDKCRASMAGTLGKYHYDCPLDNMLFTFKGITGEQFKTGVKTAKKYEAGSPMKDLEKRAYFMESCSKLVLNPETNSTFDWLEADDRATFRRKSV